MRIVRRRVRSVIGKYGLTRSDQPDVEQEIVLHLLKHLPRFNPQKSTWYTFAHRLACTKLQMIVRHQKRNKRRQDRSMVSLATPVLDADGRFVPLAETLGPGEGVVLCGREVPPGPEQVERKLDVARVVAALPPDLRQLAEYLMSGSAYKAREDLHLSWRKVAKGLAALREHFEAAGIEYFPRKPGDNDASRQTTNSRETHARTEAAAMPDLTFLQEEPADVYHAQAGKYLTSHLLADFRKCPLLYHRKTAGLIEDTDRRAYLVGRAAHTLILEGSERFVAEYVVGGPTNPNTGKPYDVKTKAFAEWQAEHGKAVISEKDYRTICSMTVSVRQHLLAKELLSAGVAEGVVRADYCGVLAQVRPDWVHPVHGIVDLKTCDDLTWFETDARRYGYVYQVAFYRAVVAQVTGRPLPVHFVSVEKKEPFRCGVWRLSDDALRMAKQENEAAIERLKRCQASGVFPTGYEETRLFDAA